MTREGKTQEKRKAARRRSAHSAVEITSHAQQSVSDLLDKWQAKVAAAVKPATTEAEAALHAEIRRHAVGLKGQDRMAFLERHGSDPRVAATLLEAPAFLTGMTEAETKLVGSKIEQAVLDPELSKPRKT